MPSCVSHSIESKLAALITTDKIFVSLLSSKGGLQLVIRRSRLECVNLPSSLEARTVNGIAGVGMHFSLKPFFFQNNSPLRRNG